MNELNRIKRGNFDRVLRRGEALNRLDDARRRRERVAPVSRNDESLRRWIGAAQIIGFWLCYAAVIVIGMYAMAGWVYQR